MAFGNLKGTFTVAANSITNPTNTGAVVTGSGVVKAGDLVYVVVGEQTSVTATAAADNLGNTYAATQVGTDAGTVTGRAFWTLVTVAGTITNIAITATASTNNVAIVGAIIEGPFRPSPLDANPTNITSDITSPFTCPPTGTLARTPEVIIAWGVATGNTVWAATSPNTLANQIATQSVLKTVIGYQTVAVTTTVSPAFTAAANPTAAVLGTTSFMGFELGWLQDQPPWPIPSNTPKKALIALAASGYVNPHYDPPPPPVEIGWLLPLSLPVRVVNLPTSQQQTLAFVKADPFPENVSAASWRQPLAEPVRRETAAILYYGSIVSPLAVDPAVPSMASWFMALSMPIKLFVRYALFAAQPEPAQTIIPPDPTPPVTNSYTVSGQYVIDQFTDNTVVYDYDGRVSHRTN